MRTTSIQISPNPVTSRFIYINGLKNNEFKDISLYNVLGQEIPFTFTGNKISLQNKYTGFAFLEIKTQEGSMTEKLIIR
ncbi:MAG: T9SS type A sorting domain-containing protein [Saprospiraceae bacterium]